MNSILFLVLGIAAVVFFFLWKEFFFVILGALAQWFTGAIGEKLKLNKIPLLFLDPEIANIVFGLVGFYLGIKYVLISIGISFLIHFIHMEILSAPGILDLIVRGLFIGVGVTLFSSGNPLLVIPYVIIASKVFTYLYNVILLRGSPFSPYSLYDVMAVFLYIISTRAFA